MVCSRAGCHLDADTPANRASTGAVIYFPLLSRCEMMKGLVVVMGLIVWYLVNASFVIFAYRHRFFSLASPTDRRDLRTQDFMHSDSRFEKLPSCCERKNTTWDKELGRSDCLGCQLPWWMSCCTRRGGRWERS